MLPNGHFFWVKKAYLGLIKRDVASAARKSCFLSSIVQSFTKLQLGTQGVQVGEVSLSLQVHKMVE